MKKGFLAALAALAIAIATPVTVFATEGSSTTGDVSINITDAAVEGIKVGDPASVVNSAWGTNFDANLVVVFTGDAHLTPVGATKPSPAITAPFNASTFNGGTVIAHQSSKDKSVTFGATITLSSDDLSPVVVLAPASSSKVPNTGDSNSNALWIGALGLSVVLAGAAIFMRKRTA